MVGIANATPDSFSDGGRPRGPDDALELLDEGALIVDVGGESTRPGFEAVSAEEEAARVGPVVRGVLARRPKSIVSVDTSKASVARVALELGASVVNDIWGLQRDTAIADLAARFSAGLILMRNGRDGLKDGCILDRIKQSWQRSVDIALQMGVAESAIVLDPGIGFGTTREEDLEILRGLAELRKFGFPVMLGASRKRITAQPLGLETHERGSTTVATTVAGVAAGIELFRVHDVAENLRAARLADLVFRGGHGHE